MLYVTQGKDVERENRDVVSLTEWKESQSLAEYYNVLDFHQLVLESREIIQELEEKPLDQDLSNRSKLIMAEINNRLDSQNNNLANSLREIRQKVEKKMQELGEIFS